MVFIDDPDVTYMKEDDVERFKRLSGLPDLALDREEARNFQHGQRNDRDDERQVMSRTVELHFVCQVSTTSPSVMDGSFEGWIVLTSCDSTCGYISC